MKLWQRGRARRGTAIPLSSMSDVAFLLLIFIMLVSLINYRREVKIEYPEAETARKTSAEKNLEIWIDGTGALYIDGEAAALRDVEYAVADLYRDGSPDTRVHIIADRHTPYKHVNGVLDVLKVLQYRVVSLVVKDGQG